MNSFNIIYEQHGKYSAIVYPVSYLNPIDEIQLISIELRKHLPAGCYVLFDLLLSNGNNFNRFAEAFFDGNDINFMQQHFHQYFQNHKAWSNNGRLFVFFYLACQSF